MFQMCVCFLFFLSGIELITTYFIEFLCISVHFECVFVCVQAQCQVVRKKKDLELQILTEPIRNWEGDDIKTLGPVLHMSQATVHTQNCQVLITALQIT